MKNMKSKLCLSVAVFLLVSGLTSGLMQKRNGVPLHPGNNRLRRSTAAEMFSLPSNMGSRSQAIGQMIRLARQMPDLTKMLGGGGQSLAKIMGGLPAPSSTAAAGGSVPGAAAIAGSMAPVTDALAAAGGSGGGAAAITGNSGAIAGRMKSLMSPGICQLYDQLEFGTLGPILKNVCVLVVALFSGDLVKFFTQLFQLLNPGGPIAP